MKTRTFYFQGATRIVGRFGTLNAGDKVVVDDDDYALAMERNPADWLEEPTARDSIIGQTAPGVQTKSAAYTILNSDRIIKADTVAAAGAFTLTLPAAPASKQVVEVIDSTGAAAAKNVTITPLAAAVVGPGAAGTDLITSNAHGLSAGDRVKFSGAGLAVPLVAGTVYFARDISANTFKVAATKGGAAIDLTVNSSNQSWQKVTNLIDDSAADLVINTNGGSKRLFFSGSQWKTF